MTIVSDSSPLVIFSKLGRFDLLPQLFPVLHISVEVQHEVVIAGEGLPGSWEVANAEWIKVTKLQDPASMLVARERYALGAGELSTILLGKSSAPISFCSMTTRRAGSPPPKASTFAAPSACLNHFTAKDICQTFAPPSASFLLNVSTLINAC